MTRVTWEATKEVDLSFSQGIFSKTQYALLSNSGLVTVNQDPGIDIYYREELETNENSEVGLKYVPLSPVTAHTSPAQAISAVLNFSPE